MHKGLCMTIAILLLVTIAPLLFLGMFVLADGLNLRIAERILDWTMAALAIQWRLGSVINVAGGAALAAGGVWCALSLDHQTRWIAAIVLVPVGFWRIRRGVGAWTVSTSIADELRTGHSHERR